jgi:hypothetical protein
MKGRKNKMMVGNIVGGLFGLAIGTGIAFCITMSRIKKSNDIGDSHATLWDFGDLYVIANQEDLHAENTNKYGYDILKYNLQKIMDEEA